MAEDKIKRTMNTRISLKIDTWENWNTSNTNTQAAKTNGDLVLARGEIAFVQMGSNIPPVPAHNTVNGDSTETLKVNPDTVLFKVGDGQTAFKNLKWGSAIAADVYDWAKVDEEAFYKKLTGKTTVTKTETFVTTTDFNQTINDMKDADVEGSLANLISELTAATTGSGSTSLASRISAVEALAGIGGDGDTGSLATVKYVDDQDKALLGTQNTADATNKATIWGAKKDAADAASAVDELKTKEVKANTDAIAVLNGNATTAGSVAKAVADAKTDIVGTSSDVATKDTIKGAKKYADGISTTLMGDASTSNTIMGAQSVADAAAAKLVGLSEDTVQESITEAITTAKSELIGKSGDAKTASTIYGAKAFATGAVADLKTELMGDATSTANTIKGVGAIADAAKGLADAATTKLADITEATVQASINKAALNAKNAVIGDSTSDKDSDTVKGAKLFATDADTALKTELMGAVGTADTIKNAQSVADDAKSLADTATAQLAGLVSNETTNKTVQGAIDKAKADAKTELVGDATVSGIDSNALSAPTFTESTDVPHTITGAKKYAYDLVKNLLTAYILDDNTGAVDKLNEIAEWITDDASGAAKIIADVEKKLNSSDFDTFKTGDFKTLSNTVNNNKANWDTAYTNAKDLTNHTVLKDITASDVETWNAVTSKANASDLQELEAKAHTDDNVFYIDCGTSTTNAFLVESV